MTADPISLLIWVLLAVLLVWIIVTIVKKL